MATMGGGELTPWKLANTINPGSRPPPRAVSQHSTGRCQTRYQGKGPLGSFIPGPVATTSGTLIYHLHTKKQTWANTTSSQNAHNTKLLGL